MARRRIAEESKRFSTSVPLDHYDELIKVADDKRVSVAWVVREAVEQYLAGRAQVTVPARQRQHSGRVK